jgi:TRAP-type C4-dicarboxylate transport system permease large subunit
MSGILTYENIPQSVSAALLGISDNRDCDSMIINALLLFVGVFIDYGDAGGVLIFTPIFLPVVTQWA